MTDKDVELEVASTLGASACAVRDAVGADLVIVIGVFHRPGADVAFVGSSGGRSESDTRRIMRLIAGAQAERTITVHHGSAND